MIVDGCQGGDASLLELLVHEAPVGDVVLCNLYESLSKGLDQLLVGIRETEKSGK